MPEPAPSSPASVNVDPRAAAAARPEGARRSKLALLAFLLALLPFGSWGACVSGVVDEDDGAALVAWVVTCVLALVGVVVGVVAWRRIEARADGRASGRTLAISAIVFGLFSPIVSALLGLFTLDINFGHGRALRRKGKQLVAGDVVVDAGWLRPLRPLSAPPAVARAWRQSGATEAASVVAFDRLADALAARGAPPSLIERARENARQEEHHARLCYSLAAAIDGRALGPRLPAPPRDDVVAGAGDLVRFAAENVVESCLFEGAAADAARVLGDRAKDDDVKAVLAVIADDEAGHAAHGWAIVDWCKSVAGDAVVAACVRAVSAVDAARVAAAVDDGYEEFGVAGPTTWRAALARERKRCLRRLRG